MLLLVLLLQGYSNPGEALQVMQAIHTLTANSSKDMSIKSIKIITFYNKQKAAIETLLKLHRASDPLRYAHVGVFSIDACQVF